MEEEALVAEGASDQDTADAGDEEAEDAGGEGLDDAVDGEAEDAGDEEPEDEQEPEEESICTHLATIRNADVRNCHSVRDISLSGKMALLTKRRNALQKSHRSRSSMFR